MLLVRLARGDGNGTPPELLHELHQVPLLRLDIALVFVAQALGEQPAYAGTNQPVGEQVAFEQGVGEGWHGRAGRESGS